MVNMEDIGGKDLDNELHMLKSRLKHTHDRVTCWMSDEIKQLVMSQSGKHEATVKQMQEHKVKYEALGKENVITNQKLEEGCSQLENMKTEMEQLYTVSQELHASKSKTEAQIKYVKQDIDQIKKDIDAPTQAKQKLEYLNKASSIFSKMLGLTFKKTQGSRIQVIFTNIDEKDPLMAFYFFLQIQGAGRKYVVSDSEPAINGMDVLVTELNETNNLRQFMIAMRSKFKDSVKHN